MRSTRLLAALVALAGTTACAADPPYKALILDGQNNHAWKTTTPLLKKALEESGLFRVDVSTSPPAKGDMSAWKPDFAAYQVVVSNYNGQPWSKETQAAFVKFVEGGGVTVSRFLQAGLLDRLHLTVAPILIGSGRPSISLESISTLDHALRPACRRFTLGEDVLFDLELRAPRA